MQDKDEGSETVAVENGCKPPVARRTARGPAVLACLTFLTLVAAPASGQQSLEVSLRIQGPSERLEGVEAHFALLPFERPVRRDSAGYAPVVTTQGKALAAAWTPPVEIVWDFGDGSQPVVTGERVSVSHRYEDQGNYTVKATATGVDDFKAEGRHEIVISNRDPSSVRVRAAPAVGVARGIDLTATAQDTAADKLKYHWDFGDGKTAEGEDLWKVRHVYPTTGNFKMRLTVRDEDGGTTTKDEDVKVAGVVEPGSLPEPISPEEQPEAVADGLRGRITGAIVWSSSAMPRPISSTSARVSERVGWPASARRSRTCSPG